MYYMVQLRLQTFVLQGVTDMIAVNGSCTHFVQQVSVTPIVVDSITVAVAPCERALRIEVNAIGCPLDGKNI